jgi:hypothetical protein
MSYESHIPENIEETKTDAWRELLRHDIENHLASLRLPNNNGNGDPEYPSKEAIRVSHQKQRIELFEHEKKMLAKYWDKLPTQFANGNEVDPEIIEPELEVVDSKGYSGILFRYASLLWSVPVSKGYGRRIRYLVRDKQNGKLIGIFALNDPVFNLSARDDWIGWSVDDRRERLVHVMDAYVVGAVPPYSYLLGGKLITSLIGSSDVSDNFAEKYSDSKGIISQKRKEPRLALVTVTSALGRSSIYNRLKLVNQDKYRQNLKDDDVIVELIKIGETKGYGHFHLSNGIFNRIRLMLTAEGHDYAQGHQFGDGPNWRFRVIRIGLEKLGMDKEILRHGIFREVYAIPMFPNFREFLNGDIENPNLNRPSASEIAYHAKSRWVVPRSKRVPDFKKFRRTRIPKLINPKK